jgi:UDP-glucose 4-epimerase
MKYLILGGAGFVGTYLSKKLISRGETVTIVDSLTTSKKPDYDVNFIHGDIKNLDVEDLIKDHDIIYFLAGSVGVSYNDKNPQLTLDNNIGLMNKLIPLFRKYNKKVIFTSTSEVYGDGPFSEDNHLTIGPPTKLRWAYSFPYIIIRFFNVVGPGQLPDYGMVLPRFINAAKSDENLIVHGDGSQIRTFCHVEDAVECLLELEKFNGEIFNVGNDVPITIKELAEKVITISNSNSKIDLTPYEKEFSKHHSDIKYRCPDLTKIKSFINYRPKKSIEDIINDCL